MTKERKPWLFLKRVNTWNPLAGVKDLMPPAAPPPDAPKPPRPRWI